MEFDRCFRSVLRDPAYRGKRVMLISGLNIDISPAPDERFPQTKFCPWAALVKQPDGSHVTVEQGQLVKILQDQPVPSVSDGSEKRRFNLEEAIQHMEQQPEVALKAPDRG